MDTQACKIHFYGGYTNVWRRAACFAQQRLHRSIMDLPLTSSEHDLKASVLLPNAGTHQSEWKLARQMLDSIAPELATTLAPGLLAAAAPRCPNAHAASRRAATAARQMLDPRSTGVIHDHDQACTGVPGISMCAEERGIRRITGSNTAEPLSALTSFALAEITTALGDASCCGSVSWPAWIDAPILPCTDHGAGSVETQLGAQHSNSTDIQGSGASIFLQHLQV